jgi:hypothetical protein
MSKSNGLSFATNYAALKSVQKAYAPALSRSAEAAIAEYDRTVSILKTGGNGDRLAPQAQHARAVTACQLEVVKAARTRPVGYGDLGMINFLRDGRP